MSLKIEMCISNVKKNVMWFKEKMRQAHEEAKPKSEIKSSSSWIAEQSACHKQAL